MSRSESPTRAEAGEYNGIECCAGNGWDAGAHSHASDRRRVCVESPYCGGPSRIVRAPTIGRGVRHHAMPRRPSETEQLGLHRACRTEHALLVERVGFTLVREKKSASACNARCASIERGSYRSRPRKSAGNQFRHAIDHREHITQCIERRTSPEQMPAHSIPCTISASAPSHTAWTASSTVPT